MAAHAPDTERFNNCRATANHIAALEEELQTISWSQLGQRTHNKMALALENADDWFIPTSDCDDNWPPLSQVETSKSQEPTPQPTGTEKMNAGDEPEKSSVSEAVKLAGELKKLKEQLQQEFLDAYRPNILFMTLSSVLDDRVFSYSYDGVIVDEAGHAMEAKILPLLRKMANNGNPFICVIGDPKQLPVRTNAEGPAPVVASTSPLDRTTTINNIRPVILNYWYRSHPWLSRFSNESFYGMAMKNGVTRQWRR